MKPDGKTGFNLTPEPVPQSCLIQVRTTTKLYHEHQRLFLLSPRNLTTALLASSLPLPPSPNPQTPWSSTSRFHLTTTCLPFPPKMRLIIRDNADQASAYIANYIVERIKHFSPTSAHPFVLGLPTGSSPLGVYKILVQKYKAGDISFENVITFNMVGFPCPLVLPPSVYFADMA